MDGKEMKKILAGLGIATLVSAAGGGLPGAVHAGSGWGGKPDGTVGADKEKSAGTSGWGGQTDGAVSTDDGKKPEDAKKSDEEKADKEAEPAEKKTGGSGWGGSH